MLFAELTIVIATICRDSLGEMLASIQKSSMLPSKVIVVYPAESPCELLKKRTFTFEIELVPSPVRNQIFQRQAGMALVETKYYLYADDDLIFSEDTLHNAVSALESLTGKKAVIGPVFLRKDGSFFNSSNTVFVSWLKRVYYRIFHFVIFDNKKGAISYTCNTLAPNDDMSKLFREVAWLPGGLVAGFTDQMIFNQDYIIGVKAFREDCFMSYLRHKAGMAHYRINNMNVVLTQEAEPKLSVSEIFDDIRTQIHYARLMNCSMLKLSASIIGVLIFYIFSKTKG